MQREDMKTFGAVEMTLGLLDVSLGSLLLNETISFKKDVMIVFITGVWTTVSGFFLVCGGTKPSYNCVKFNACCQLATLLISGTGLGFLVRRVLYQQVHCIINSCYGDDSRTVQFLLSGILIILITTFVVEMLISLVVSVIGLCSMVSDFPEQPEDTARMASATAEPLCALPHDQEIHGESGVKMDIQ